MEDVQYKVKVERFDRLQTFLLICGVMWLAYGISYGIESAFGIVVRGEMVLLVLLVLLCVLMTKWEQYFPTTIELEVEFKKDAVLFRKGRKERKITYADIREVEKMMIINRYHSEKGYYRVKVQMRGRSYAMYSGEESSKELDFDETDVSKIYYEFKRRGVKCC